MLAVLIRPFIRYNELLERHPGSVKSVTSGITYCLGDVIAQAGVIHHGQRALPEAERKPILSQLDWKRAGLFFLHGTFVAGPLYHHWFDRLDRLPAAFLKLRQHRARSEIMRSYATLQRHGIKVDLKLEKLPVVKPLPVWADKAMKILADQLIFSSLYTAVFFISIGMLTGAAEVWESEAQRHSLEAAESLIRSRRKAAAAHDANGSSSTAGGGAGGSGSGNGAEHADEAAAAVTISSATREQQLDKLRDMLVEGLDVDESSIDKVLSLLRAEEEQLSREHTMRLVWGKTWAHMKEVYWETFLADCVVWPGLQFINFTFVPLRFQVLYVNVCNLAWNTFLSIQSTPSH